MTSILTYIYIVDFYGINVGKIMANIPYMDPINLR